MLDCGQLFFHDSMRVIRCGKQCQSVPALRINLQKTFLLHCYRKKMCVLRSFIRIWSILAHQPQECPMVTNGVFHFVEMCWILLIEVFAAGSKYLACSF